MSLIIDHPKEVPLPRRVGWGFVTFLFWMLWFYLWVPLITFVAWALGLNQAFNVFQWENDVMELKRLVVIYILIIAALGSCLLLWAFSEFMRFRNLNRRTKPTSVRTEECAAYAEVRAKDMEAWQKSRSMIAFHDDHGELIDGEVLRPGS